MAGTKEYEDLAAEEASLIKEEEKPFFNKSHTPLPFLHVLSVITLLSVTGLTFRQAFTQLMDVLPAEHRAKAEDNPLDILIIVRGFQKDMPREEKTIEALMRIVHWRDKIGYFNFMDQHFEGEEAFYKYWPESIFGADKYGHFLQCIRVRDIDIDKVEELGEDIVEVLQGQKMRMYGEYKRQLSEQSGVQRYKHSLVIDLDGVSMSLGTNSKHRAFLKRIFDVGTHYYPETMWKIYLLNSPYLFRGLWVVAKPWLHPITQAKVNVLGSYPSAMKAMEADGVPAAAMPDWMGGGCKGTPTIEFVRQTLDVKSK